MKDTKYPYRCKAIGISSWIPLEKAVSPDHTIQILMSRPMLAKYNDVKFPGFAQPLIPRFGQIYRIEKNPHYVNPGSGHYDIFVLKRVRVPRNDFTANRDHGLRVTAEPQGTEKAPELTASRHRELHKKFGKVTFQLNRGVGERRGKK